MSGPALPSSSSEMFSCVPYSARITGATCLKRQDLVENGEKGWTGRGAKPFVDASKCKGCQLGEQVRASIAKGPLPPLAQLREKAVVHRDIKPENVSKDGADIAGRERGGAHGDAPPAGDVANSSVHELADAVRAIVAHRAPLLQQLTAEREALLERLDGVDDLIVQLGGEPAERLIERAVADASPMRKRGRPPGRFGTTLRVDDLKRLLASHPEGLTIYEISAALGVTARSIRRYFEADLVGVEKKLIGGPHPALFRLRDDEGGRDG